MKRFGSLYVLVLLGLSSVIHAQLPYTFTQIANINDGGETIDVEIGPDGTVFLLKGSDGLWAYSFDGTTFTNTAHIADGDSGFAGGIAFASDGTIFLANGFDGLRAYSYDGASFTNIAHIDDGSYSASDVAVDSDGSVFLAQGLELRAYHFDGSSFTNTAHINTGTWPWRMVVFDSKIFLAIRSSPINSGGLEAYIYDDSSFTITANLDSLGGYSWDGRAGVDVIADSTIFLASGFGHLWAFRYNGSTFSNTAHIQNGDKTNDIAVLDDGTIFLADGHSGLWAYSFDGSTFTINASTDEIIDVDEASGVAVSLDGTIFYASATEGLIAYSYNPVTGIDDNASPAPGNYMLAQNYPNPFNPSTTIEFTLMKNTAVTIKVFDISGKEVAAIVDGKTLAAGIHRRVFDAGNLPNGVYLYRMQAGNFEQTRKLVLVK